MQSASHRDWHQIVVSSLVVMACIAAIAWFQVPKLQQLQTQSQTATVETIRREVEAETIRLKLLQKTPAFGFDNLLSDWAFLGFLQYFGDEPARAKTGYGLSPEYFEIVLGRNPYFLRGYTFLSTSTALYAGMPERSVAIAQKAAQSLQPDAPEGSYYALRVLAIDQLLFLGDPQAAQRSFETAAEWAEGQGNRNAANLSRQTAAFLANNPNSKSAQVAAWAMILTTAPDPGARQTAIDRIRELGGKLSKIPMARIVFCRRRKISDRALD